METASDAVRRPVYMDHHATTPVDPRVLEAMLPYFTERFGNAASIDHQYGAEAARAVELARQQVAQLINARPDEIIFTSGATESNNLAIIGAAERYADRGNHIITCVTEHKAVLDTCHHLEKRGWRVTYLPVDRYGLVDLEALRLEITPRTVLISIMTANNEIGTIAPVEEIGRLAGEHEILFHTDATQAVGSIPVDVGTMNIDLLSLSAHKIYGPKGIGALFVRKRRPRVKLAEQIHGGGHERKMRSGTLNVPGIVALGKAAQLCGHELETGMARLRQLRERLWLTLQAELSQVELNGHPIQRLAQNLSVAIPGVESQSLLVQLKDEVAVSTGSACTTSDVEPSHVILALGYGPDRAYCSLRFGLGRSTTEDEVDFVARCVSISAERVRKLTRLG